MDSTQSTMLVGSSHFYLFFSALFSAAETAFSSLNSIRLKQYIKNEVKHAQQALELVNDYTHVITTILIGNNIANIAMTTFATLLFSSLFKGNLALSLSMTALTILILLFAEILPKVLAKQHPESFAIFITPFIRFFRLLFSPIASLMSWVEKEVLKQGDDKVTATEDELVEIVQTIEMEGVLDQEERELIESAISFDDKTVREIMKTRDQVVFLYDNATPEQIINAISTHKYSRIPVISYVGLYAIGIIRERDVLECLLHQKPISMENLLRPVSYISQRQRLQNALEKLQKSREHMAIVVETMKNKNFVGIVTLEDILEEIVGEIYDEYDDLPKFVVEIGHHTFDIEGIVPVKKFFDDYLDDDDILPTTAKTFADWVDELAQETKLRKNKEFKQDNYALRVLQVKEGRAVRIELNVYSKTSQDD
ncbi:MAG: hemolysin family protein [Erysipelotrichaceae bacterium]|nr:hemolysin family protein [Erysipelotrichaceae bacterium]